MRVLIACEFSGVVRDAFSVRGHDAVSCDLIPSESAGPHIVGDVRDVLADAWDLLIALARPLEEPEPHASWNRFRDGRAMGRARIAGGRMSALDNAAAEHEPEMYCEHGVLDGDECEPCRFAWYESALCQERDPVKAGRS